MNNGQESFICRSETVFFVCKKDVIRKLNCTKCITMLSTRLIKEGKLASWKDCENKINTYAHVFINCTTNQIINVVNEFCSLTAIFDPTLTTQLLAITEMENDKENFSVNGPHFFGFYY